jgi:hypothetical protein
MSEGNGGCPRHKVCSIQRHGPALHQLQGTDRGGAAAVPMRPGTSLTSVREPAHMHSENSQIDSITFSREGAHYGT